MSSSARERTVGEALYALLKVAYTVVGMPVLLLIGIVTLCALSSERTEAKIAGLPLLAVLVWTAILVPVALYFRGKQARSNQLKNILKSLKSDTLFRPDKCHETLSAAMGKYFGIDLRNGTILYVNMIRKGQFDVVGMTMADWTHRELDDKRLRLYTKFVDLPCIEIASYEAQRWYDMLGAMELKRFNTSKPFPEYVREQVAHLEREHQIHVPRVA